MRTCAFDAAHTQFCICIISYSVSLYSFSLFLFFCLCTFVDIRCSYTDALLFFLFMCKCYVDFIYTDDCMYFYALSIAFFYCCVVVFLECIRNICSFDTILMSFIWFVCPFVSQWLLHLWYVGWSCSSLIQFSIISIVLVLLPLLLFACLVWMEIYVWCWHMCVPLMHTVYLLFADIWLIMRAYNRHSCQFGKRIKVMNNSSFHCNVIIKFHWIYIRCNAICIQHDFTISKWIVSFFHRSFICYTLIDFSLFFFI